MIEDQLERAVRSALRTHAEEAPGPGVDTALRARRYAARRRRGKVVAIGLTMTAVIATAVIVSGLARSGESPPATSQDNTNRDDAPHIEQPPPLPDGWHWESFAGVELGVPDSFHWGYRPEWTTGECRRELAPPGKAIALVGRPSFGEPVDLGHCPADDPAVHVETGPTFVAFDYNRAGAPDGSSTVGDRTTVILDDVVVAVQAAQPLREQIVSTVHRVDVDAHGCPDRHPAIVDLSSRPEPAVAVGTLRDVTAIAVCQYDKQAMQHGIGATLYASARLDGGAAADEVAAIADAPLGGNPDAQTCPESASEYGSQIIVLRIDSASGTSEVYLRYNGCQHNGFDDGVGVRRMSMQTLEPLVGGSVFIGVVTDVS